MHGNDNEFCKGLSNTQKRKISVQAQHVLKALVILEDYYKEGKDITDNVVKKLVMIYYQTFSVELYNFCINHSN